MAGWKSNLFVLWIGQFFVMAGMTMIIPFLSLYLQTMGIHDPKKVAIWAGVIFAGNFVSSFIFQPIWGSLADRYGRKVMLLRSGFGMAVVMTLMGFAVHPWQLLVLRILNGTISGFNPTAVALVSASTPKDKMGFALGTLQSGGVAGTILGPFIGGMLADWFGFRPIFYITGALLFIASLLALFVVKETFNKSAAAKKPKMSVFSGFRQLRVIPQLPSLYAATIFIQFAMLSSMPIMPLYIQQLSGSAERIAFFSGLVGAVTGISNMIASPLLGRWGDRIGSEKILGLSMLGAAVLLIPQAFASHVWELLAMRFMFGVCVGGLLPSINTLIRKYTPDGMESRAFSFNTSALALGNMLGPVIGGILSGIIGIPSIFLLASALFFINAFWVKQTILRKLCRQHHAV